MGKGGSAKQQVTAYSASIHLGICHSADAITKIIVGDKVAWQGRQVGPGIIEINRPDLFGGEKKEGGVVGRVYVLPGHDTQVMPSALAGRFGLLSANCPAFRGLMSLFFVGHAGSASVGEIVGSLFGFRGPGSGRLSSGFYWGTTPFIQPMKVQVERTPVAAALNSSKAIFPDGTVNPAHIIYECLTDTEFGMGAPSYQIGTASFNAAANLFWREKFGLAMIWTRQAPIEDFIAEVLDHVQATLYVNPRTGLFDIKALRDDYDVMSLPPLTVDNCDFRSFDRKMWGETSNEIVVTWTNPENEQEETVVHHDLANIVNQGSIVSDSRNYYAVRNGELAARLAARDSRASAAPLALVEAEAMRTQWDALPGELRRVTWAEKGLFDTVMRVMQARNGPKGSSKIRLSLMEDVFSLSRPRTFSPPATQAVEPEYPTEMTSARIFTLPAFLVNRTISRGVAGNITYPEVLPGILAYHSSRDAINYDLLSEEMLINGDSEWANVGTRSLVGQAILGSAINAESVTLMEGAPLATIGRGPEVGSFAVIGNGADADMEFASIRSFDGVNWTLDRGVLDTIPRAWPAGTPVWFLPLHAIIQDDEMRAAGETVDYKLLTRTSLGMLETSYSPIFSGTLSARPHLPLRPGNFAVNGTKFGEVDATSAASLVLTWANRNRLFEDGRVVRWTDGNVEPEYLQETIITVYREDGTVMFEVRGLWTETTYTIPLAWVEEETSLFIQVSCIRQGLRSLQNYGLWVRNLPVVGSPAPPPSSPVTVGGSPPPPDPPAEPTPDSPGGVTPPPTLPPGGGGGGTWEAPPAF